MAHRLAPLLHRGAGERRVADHVADRVDVGMDGLVVVVHLEQAVLAGRDAERAEAEVVRCSRRARRSRAARRTRSRFPAAVSHATRGGVPASRVIARVAVVVVDAARPSSPSSRTSVATISRSKYGSRRSRVSTSVTAIPSAAKMLAYSIPTTPAPSTVIVFGIRGSCRIVSESKTVSPSNGHVVRPVRARAGRDHEEVGGERAQLGPARRPHRHGVGPREARVALDHLDRVAAERLADQRRARAARPPARAA